MFKGDWYLIATPFVCLVGMSAALHQSHDTQHERYKNYRYTSDKPLEVDLALSRAFSTRDFENLRPCQDPKGQGESALCAQWRSTEAAESSAQAAWWLGTFGTLVGFLTLMAAAQAARWAKKAAVETGKAAGAATDAVVESRHATNAMKRANEVAFIALKADHLPDIRIKAVGPYLDRPLGPPPSPDGQMSDVPILCPIQVQNAGS